MEQEPQKKYIRMNAYAVMQAVALGKDGNIGIKSFQVPQWGNSMAIFPAKEDARNYLAGLLKTIHHEQSIGWRTKDNLVKETGLDFCIVEIQTYVDIDPLIKRGWNLPEPQQH